MPNATIVIHGSREWETLAIKEKGESFQESVNFWTSNAQYLNTLLPPKKIYKNKINCLREEDNVFTSMGGVPSPQNRARSQPHPSWESLDSQDPYDALLFFVPKTFRIGEEGRDGQLDPYSASCEEKRRVQGTQTSGYQLAPRGVHTFAPSTCFPDS